MLVGRCSSELSGHKHEEIKKVTASERSARDLRFTVTFLGTETTCQRIPRLGTRKLS